MKEGFDYSKDRKNIVNKNISEVEKKYWAEFEPTEETPNDASQEEIIEASLDKHEDLFNEQKELFGSEEESKEADRYQQLIRERGKKLYRVGENLSACMVALYHEDADDDILTKTIAHTKVIEALNQAIQNIKYIKSEDDELSNDELNSLGVSNRLEYEIKKLVKKLEDKEKISMEDLDIIGDIAKRFDKQGKELMFMDTTIVEDN